jgi:hydrogenase-4 component F
MEPVIIILILLLAALASLALKNLHAIEGISIGASGVAFIAAISLALSVSGSTPSDSTRFFSVDALAAIIALIIGAVGLAAAVYSVFYLRVEMGKGIIGFHRVRQYFILFNLFLLAMFFAVMVNNPILMWIAIESTTLSTVFLISFYDKPTALEAAWKYLIINSTGLLLGFFGTLLYFTPLRSATGSDLTSWEMLTANTAHLDPVIAKIAFVFVLIGYGTKVGLAPMHTWLPDAHSKAPAPVSALLSGVLLNIAFFAVLRFKLLTDAVVGPAFSGRLLLVFGLFSIIIAALIMLTQQNYKRLLAYSSIENMGIITLGFGVGGIGAFAAILHMIYHALVKPALFFLAGNIFLKYSSTKIANIRGVISTLPVTAWLFIAGFFAVTGTPPFGIFLTKVYVLSACVGVNPLAGFIAIAAFALVFIGFLRQAIAMMFGEKSAEMPIVHTSPMLCAAPLLLLAAVLILSFYLPGFLFELITEALGKYSL